MCVCVHIPLPRPAAILNTRKHNLTIGHVTWHVTSHVTACEYPWSHDIIILMGRIVNVHLLE